MNHSTLKTASVTPSLRTTFAWTLVGNSIYAGCQWGMVACLAKMGSTSAVGQFALAFAITAPVFMLTNLFLRGVQATDARAEYKFHDYFTLRLIGTVTGLIIVSASMLFIHSDRQTRLVIMAVALAKAVESFSDVIAGLLQKHERLDQVAISMMFKGVISLAAFAATYFISHSVLAASIALVLSWMAVFATYDMRLARTAIAASETFLASDFSILLRLARLAAPVGIVTALGALNVNIPRYILERYRGSSELGIFAALGYSVIVLGLIVNALGQSAVVRLSRSFAEARTDEYLSLIRRMSLIGVAAAALAFLSAVFVGRPLLRLIYGAEYASGLPLLLLFIVTSGVNAVASFVGYGMTAARRFGAQVPVFVVTLITSGMVSWMLVPRWGMYGAGAALLCSALAQLAGSALVVWSAVRSVGIPTPMTLPQDLLASAEAMVPGCE